MLACQMTALDPEARTYLASPELLPRWHVMRLEGHNLNAVAPERSLPQALQGMSALRDAQALKYGHLITCQQQSIDQSHQL